MMYGEWSIVRIGIEFVLSTEYNNCVAILKGFTAKLKEKEGTEMIYDYEVTTGKGEKHRLPEATRRSMSSVRCTITPHSLR